jgi:hypothetical protein
MLYLEPQIHKFKSNVSYLTIAKSSADARHTAASNVLILQYLCATNWKVKRQKKMDFQHHRKRMLPLQESVVPVLSKRPCS